MSLAIQSNRNVTKASKFDDIACSANEPIGNSDNKTGKTICKLLHVLSRSFGTTVIVVTYDLEIEEKAVRTYQLYDKKLVEHKK